MKSNNVQNLTRLEILYILIKDLVQIRCLLILNWATMIIWREGRDGIK